MTMTYGASTPAYTETAATNAATADDTVFVPRYARRSRAKKSVKTWMILAPIGAVVVLGGAAALMMDGGDRPALGEAQPAAAQAPVATPSPVASAPVLEAAQPAPVASTPVEQPAPPPAAVQRRAAPATPARRAMTPAPTVRAAEPAATIEPTGPRAYSAASSAAAAPSITTQSLNAGPAAATPAAPIIVTQPLN